MPPLKLSFIVLSFAFTELAAWTIDLPEARKFFFENAEKGYHNEEIKKDYNEAQRLFDNILPDSPHNKDEVYHHNLYEPHISQKHHHHENDVYGDKYANDYEYLSYMEKKVTDIAHNGSIYLEGLRRALEDYGDLLQNCSRQNFSQPRSPNGPWLPENEQPIPQSPPGSSGNFGPGNFGPGNFGPGNFVPANISNTFGPGNFSQMPNQTFMNLFNQSQITAETCERATRASEHVRRLAELALWATRELQDRAYASKFEKQTHDQEEEEAELLLRLAFFLDRLAHYTGYEPKPEAFITTTTSRPELPSLPPVSAMGNVSDETKRRMMDCISSNSPDPDKCRFPDPLPEFIRRRFNITDSPDSVLPVSTESYRPTDPSYREVFKNPTVAPFRRQKRETAYEETEDPKDQESSPTLIATAALAKRLAHKVGEIHEDKSFEHFHEPHHKPGLIERFVALRHSRRKLIEKIAELSRHSHHEEEEEFKPVFEFKPGFEFKTGFAKRESARNKRSVHAKNPALEIMKYYVKHQVWTNSNPGFDTKHSGEFDVDNDLKTVKVAEDYQQPIRRIKRAYPKIAKKYEHLRLPEDPFQDISNIVKHKNGVNYITDGNEIEKTRQYLDKLRNSNTLTPKNYAQKILKKRIQKRSVKYMNKFLPSRSQNPRQDISYYVKNKEGTDYNNNLVQAAQVRASLEMAFQNPNIEVVRRFGSNYNPAVPFPLGFGIAESFFGDI